MGPARSAAFTPLTLGTAQLGMPYGLGAARTGLDVAAAFAILDAAWQHGLRCFDTARAYGDAEARIGRWLGGARDRDATLVSKFLALDAGDPAADLARNLDLSLAALGRRRIDVYLAHRGADLLRSGVTASLENAMSAGRIGCFGASVYEPAEADALLAVPGLSALQLPLSLANGAFVESGLIARAADRGIAVFARSVFLQGLLLGAAPGGAFAPALPALRRFAQLADAANLPRAALALAAVRAHPGVASIVVGADSAAQVSEIARAFAERPESAVVTEAWKIFADFPAELTDPRRWPPQGA
jgi:aryl-alcohol dehydrogenase-like predicted oxidoreductase